MSLAALLLTLVAAPEVSLTVPAPKKTLPLAARTLSWLGLADPDLGGDRLSRRSTALLDLDLLSVEALERAGFDLEHAARVVIEPEAGVLVLALAVRDAARVRGLVDRWRSRWARLDELEGGTGFVTGSSDRSTLAAHLTRGTLWLVLGRDAAPPLIPGVTTATLSTTRTRVAIKTDRRLLPLARALSRDRPLLAKALAGGAPPDAWGSLRAGDRVERADGALRFQPRGLRGEVEAWLDTRHEVAMQEILRATPAGPLLATARLPVIAEARAVLNAMGLRQILSRAGLPAEIGAQAAGPVELLLTERGDLIGAAELKAKVDRAALAGIMRGLSARRGVQVSLLERTGRAPILVAWVGSLAPAEVTAAAAMSVRTGPSATLRVRPTRLLEALSLRAAAEDGFAPRAMDLVFLRFTLRALFEATESVEVEVRPKGTRLVVGAEVLHQ